MFFTWSSKVNYRKALSYGHDLQRAKHAFPWARDSHCRGNGLQRKKIHKDNIKAVRGCTMYVQCMYNVDNVQFAYESKVLQTLQRSCTAALMMSMPHCNRLFDLQSAHTCEFKLSGTRTDSSSVLLESIRQCC